MLSPDASARRTIGGPSSRMVTCPAFRVASMELPEASWTELTVTASVPAAAEIPNTSVTLAQSEPMVACVAVCSVSSSARSAEWYGLVAWLSIVPNGPVAAPVAPQASRLRIGSLKTTVSVCCVADMLTTYGGVTSFGFAVGVGEPTWVRVGPPLGFALAPAEGVGVAGRVVLGALALGRPVALGVAPALRLAVGTEVGSPGVPLWSPVSQAQIKRAIARRPRTSV